MSQRPSTIGALSCHPRQRLGFLSKRNYPSLAALLSSTFVLGKWVWPLQIFVMALHNICVQTSSGPRLTCKVISYGYSANDSPAKALPCCSSTTQSRAWPSRLRCHLYPWPYSPLSLLVLKNYIHDISIYIYLALGVLARYAVKASSAVPLMFSSGSHVASSSG